MIGENTAAVGLHTRVCDVNELVLLMPPGHPLAPTDARQALVQMSQMAQPAQASLCRSGG